MATTAAAAADKPGNEFIDAPTSPTATPSAPSSPSIAYVDSLMDWKEDAIAVINRNEERKAAALKASLGKESEEFGDYHQSTELVCIANDPDSASDPAAMDDSLVTSSASARRHQEQQRRIKSAMATGGSSSKMARLEGSNSSKSVHSTLMRQRVETGARALAERFNAQITWLGGDKTGK
eukprot:TRINITY_DN2718_c0_g1_i1.p1 TRINITY_DN2718_c0_g1~~TRINITY_DN2718_c0_g1_i1.p1  ORF type:complete len:192 (+),score=69.93 TRINITY_DN2718_c0_g1_i1:37-576(+)